MGLLNAPKYEEDDSISTSTVSKPATTQGKPKMATSSAPTTRVTTGVIRGSYCNIFKPYLPKTAKEGDVPKYGMTILIPKKDKVTLDKIAAAQEAAIALKWPTKRPAKLTFTLHDGDEPRESNGEDYGPECKGHMVMAVNSKFKPKIIDRDSNEILDPSEAGSGDYFKVSINFYGFDFSGKRGVSAGLNNVLFYEKGESLGGAGTAEEDFAEDLN